MAGSTRQPLFLWLGMPFGLGLPSHFVAESITLAALGQIVVRWTPARWAGFCRTKAHCATALPPWPAGAWACHKMLNSQGRDPSTLEIQEGFAPPSKRRRPTHSPFDLAPRATFGVPWKCAASRMTRDEQTPCSQSAGLYLAMELRCACTRLLVWRLGTCTYIHSHLPFNSYSTRASPSTAR